MAGAVRDPALLRPLQKSVADRPSGHAHRAFYQNDVFLFRIQIGVLIGLRGIALPGGHKPGGHLHAVHPQLQPGVGILSVIDSAGHDHGNRPSCLFRFPADEIQDTGRLRLIMQAADVLQLLSVKAQMAAGQRAFDHHQIRDPVIFFLPVVKNNFRGFPAGADRSQKRAALRSDFLLRFPHRLGKGDGKARAGDDQIRARQNGLPHIFLIAPCGHHDIHADDAARSQPSCPFDLRGDLPQIRFMRTPVIARLPIADLGRGDDPDPAFCRHGSRKAGKAHANPHSSLDHRNRGRQTPDLKWFQCRHFYLHARALRNAVFPRPGAPDQRPGHAGSKVRRRGLPACSACHCGSVIAKVSSAFATSFPFTVAFALPTPMGPFRLMISVSSVSTSPGTTFPLKRA